jgi:hypothetical protein
MIVDRYGRQSETVDGEWLVWLAASEDNHTWIAHTEY